MRKIYVLYTGGTIGCSGNPLAPLPGPRFLELLPKLAGLAGKRVAGYDIEYDVGFYAEPLDSSNMTPSDWVRIATTLVSVYDQYDGFVVLHGTDTMSWTASALSFLLEGLTKPVLVTGSQLPLEATLSDAPRNLITSLVIAGTLQIPEVCLFFNTALLRGNRAVKVNASEFLAFMSPNYPPLGSSGIQITLHEQLLLPLPHASVALDSADNRAALLARLAKIAEAIQSFSVIALVLFPGIVPSMMRAIFRETTPPIKGLVLQAFGEGNAPSNADFLSAIAEAHRAGLVVVDGTQVLSGSVDISAYQTGSGLNHAGAISGYDLTPEAALTKLIYLAALGHPQAEIERLMHTNLRGELVLPARA